MKKTTMLVCVLLVSTMMLTTAAVTAKKPENPGGGGGGKDTGPTGTIFFGMWDDNDVFYIWTIDPDGSGMAKRTMYVEEVQVLSNKTHNGHYWYIGLVAIEGETYQDGIPRQEIFAIRDDNTLGLQMTTDEDMAFAYQQGENLCWVPGDAYISWAGKVWADQGDGTYAYEDYGIYRAEVQYDTDGDVSGLGDPVFVYDTGSCYQENRDAYVPDIYGYSWNPEGDGIAFRSSDGYIHIDSVPTSGSPTALVEGYQPAWSPDGTKVSFTRYQEVLVIDVDGTDETSLVKVKGNQGTFKGVDSPDWSPDGEYLVYSTWEVGRATWNWKHSMYTIKADGTDRSLITGFSVYTYKYSRDWR